MRNVVPVLLVALATLSVAADKKRNRAPPKPTEIEVVEITARRGEGRVSLDGRVKNTGERAAVGIVLLFDFMAPGRQVITTKRGDLEIETLEPGEEAEFHVYAPEPPRAVEIRVQVRDGSQRDLKVIKPGPYPIE
jgi:hypothetical protein